ncbi:hypothetical protein BpHYR1_009887, partial [Brachionus plicatilis]
KCLYLAYIMNNIEILGIILASVFSSSFNFIIHTIGFGLYTLGAFLSILFSIFIERKLNKENLPNCLKELGIFFYVPITIEMIILEYSIIIIKHQSDIFTR